MKKPALYLALALGLAVVLAAALFAFGGERESTALPTPTPEITAAPTPTPAPTSEPTAMPTPTPTPEPTAAPTPTPEPTPMPTATLETNTPIPDTIPAEVQQPQNGGSNASSSGNSTDSDSSVPVSTGATTPNDPVESVPPALYKGPDVIPDNTIPPDDDIKPVHIELPDELKGNSIQDGFSIGDDRTQVTDIPTYDGTYLLQ